VAEIIAAESFSCVIDTSAMTVGERTRLFTEFAGALHRVNSATMPIRIRQ
jgi:hypothetical protein